MGRYPLCPDVVSHRSVSGAVPPEAAPETPTLVAVNWAPKAGLTIERARGGGGGSAAAGAYRVWIAATSPGARCETIR